MGLVNTVVPLDRLEDETVQWCREMPVKSPFALRLMKASFNAAEDGMAGIQQLAHDANLDPDLQTALDSLAPEFRAAVVLCDIEGLSYEEIAATLGVKLGTVRSRIHRGRQTIRDYLAARGHDNRRSVAVGN